MIIPAMIESEMDMTTTDIATITEDSAYEIQLPSVEYIERQVADIAAFQSALHRLLREGLDYGTIRGTQRPTLYKAGAEKVCRILGVEAQYAIERVEDWDAEPPFFDYEITCSLYKIGSGMRIGMGVGSCNTAETRYRYVWRDGARVVDPETPSKKNTCLKMAKKRALVDAVLGYATLSDVFAQDLEDLDIAPRSGGRAPAQSRAAPADRRPDTAHQALVAWLEREGRTLDDVAALIGAPATDGAIRRFIADRRIVDFTSWLTEQWQAQEEAASEPKQQIDSSKDAWFDFTSWLQAEIRTLTDVTRVIGVEATRTSIVRYMTDHRIADWSELQERLSAQWAGEDARGVDADSAT